MAEFWFGHVVYWLIILALLLIVYGFFDEWRK